MTDIIQFMKKYISHRRHVKFLLTIVWAHLEMKFSGDAIPGLQCRLSHGKFAAWNMRMHHILPGWLNPHYDRSPLQGFNSFRVAYRPVVPLDYCVRRLVYRSSRAGGSVFSITVAFAKVIAKADKAFYFPSKPVKFEWASSSMFGLFFDWFYAWIVCSPEGRPVCRKNQNPKGVAGRGWYYFNS